MQSILMASPTYCAREMPEHVIARGAVENIQPFQLTGNFSGTHKYSTVAIGCEIVSTTPLCCVISRGVEVLFEIQN
jgi:hypothetical protein